MMDEKMSGFSDDNVDEGCSLYASFEQHLQQEDASDSDDERAREPPSFCFTFEGGNGGSEDEGFLLFFFKFILY
jgi:hypothetical protein